jgi:hypothetical protein
MRRSDEHGQKAAHGQKASSAPLAAWVPVLAAVAIMATGCLSTFLVLQLDEFRPKVGDMVVFRAGSQDPDGWQVTVPATVLTPMAEPSGACQLDPNVIAVSGGSLVVEARQDAPVLAYRLRWAGRHTARTDDCGTEASLLVDRTNLQRLANAAGGFGIGNKGITQ